MRSFGTDCFDSVLKINKQFNTLRGASEVRAFSLWLFLTRFDKKHKKSELEAKPSPDFFNL